MFVLRALLRRQWAAAVAFTAFWTMFVALANERAWEGALVGFLFFGTAAVVVLLIVEVVFLIVEIVQQCVVQCSLLRWVEGRG